VRRLRVTLALMLAALSVATVAHADGDPASDTLVYGNVYLPYVQPSPDVQSALKKQIASVYAAGYRVKAAVIQSKTDLGAIPSLFDKPTDYAAFLGQELTTIYIGPLLIVMPNGYGIYDGGRSVAAEQSVLAGLAPPSSDNSNVLASAATGAVSALLKAGALKSKDILKPYVTALAAIAAPQALSIRYYIYDDSGYASAIVTVKRAGRVVFTGRIPSRAVSISKVLTTTVRVPAGLALRGARFCIVGVDAAGNRSGASCKPVS
jgi:hypothetical protein